MSRCGSGSCSVKTIQENQVINRSRTVFVTFTRNTKVVETGLFSLRLEQVNSLSQITGRPLENCSSIYQQIIHSCANENDLKENIFRVHLLLFISAKRTFICAKRCINNLYCTFLNTASNIIGAKRLSIAIFKYARAFNSINRQSTKRRDNHLGGTLFHVRAMKIQ